MTFRRHDRRPNKQLATRLDSQLADGLLVKRFERPLRGWIWAARSSFGMTLFQLATRLGVSQPAMTKLERSEIAKTITIGKLEKIANALMCDFVYGFVPMSSYIDTPRDRARAIGGKTDAEIDALIDQRELWDLVPEERLKPEDWRPYRNKLSKDQAARLLMYFPAEAQARPTS